MSSVSHSCRIEWRPSPVLCLCLIGLGGLAALSLCLSALPWPAAALSSLLVVGYSVVLASNEWRREPLLLTWAGDGNDALLNYVDHQQSWSAPQLMLRGPLASLSGLDKTGRRHFLLWWPDTLPSAARRDLRLLWQAGTRSTIKITAALH